MLRVGALVVAALIAGFGPQTAAQASPAVEQQAVDLLNADRAQRGLPQLAVRSDLTRVARAHSGSMATSGYLHHNPSLTTDVSGWTRIAENVGVGRSISSVHLAFMSSSAHRANILDTRVTEVGVGVETRDGQVWVTQIFRQPSGASAPSSSTTTYAGFHDVSAGSTHAQAIKSLVDRGVARGCAPGRYCPQQEVTRAQLATLLVRAMDGVEPVSGSRFSDVPSGSTHAGAIAALADRGILRGCGSGRYCPSEPVSRAQMATLLTRAFEWPTHTPSFRDVPTRGTHSLEIGGTAAAGVTKGCRTDRFCPTDHVTRAEMASFLDRALRR